MKSPYDAAGRPTQSEVTAPSGQEGLYKALAMIMASKTSGPPSNGNPTYNDAGRGTALLNSLGNAQSNLNYAENSADQAAQQEADWKPHAKYISDLVNSDPKLKQALARLGGHMALDSALQGKFTGTYSGPESASSYKMMADETRPTLEQIKREIGQ